MRGATLSPQPKLIGLVVRPACCLAGRYSLSKRRPCVDGYTAANRPGILGKQAVVIADHVSAGTEVDRHPILPY